MNECDIDYYRYYDPEFDINFCKIKSEQCVKQQNPASNHRCIDCEGWMLFNRDWRKWSRYLVLYSKWVDYV